MSRRKTSQTAQQKREIAAGQPRSRPGAAEQAIIVALEEWRKPQAPRARMQLRAIMRKIGLDEWKIAWLLNFKIHLLAESRKSSDNKLLLDYLKEAARHLDPASLRNAMLEATDVEVVHNAPAPEREGPSS